MHEVAGQVGLSLRLPAPADGAGEDEEEAEVRLAGGHGRALVQCGQALLELDSTGAVAATRALPAWCGPGGRNVSGLALCGTRSGLHAVLAGREGFVAARIRTSRAAARPNRDAGPVQ